jgi:hypothetical protein
MRRTHCRSPACAGDSGDGGDAAGIGRVDAGTLGQEPSHTLDVATSCRGDQGLIAQVSGAFLRRGGRAGGP